MNARLVPKHSQILVIGGGPAGSYAASVLVREGFDVVLLEANKFPRYHVGESMIPSLHPFLRFIDADEKVSKHGFALKRGAAVKFTHWKKEGYTDFMVKGPENAAYNVIRSEFDEILLRHAEECGTQVFEEHKVTQITFEGDRPTKADYQGPGGVEGSISFDYLVDASGRNGLVSTKYLKNRRMNAALKNLACWGYWNNAGVYMPDTSRHNAVVIEAMTDESGWSWYIPLHDGSVSVGVIMDADLSAQKKARGREAAGENFSLKHHYLEQLEYLPMCKKLLEGATLRENYHAYPAVQSASDYSYSATSYAGDHYRLVGDASAFIDPFFSSGVHLAFSSGFSAAMSIAASIRGHCSEKDAGKFHTSKVATAYTRFLLVVLSSYKQIKSQDAPLLSDVDEDNYDRAFNLLRPIIQGTADVDKKLTNAELAQSMDFVLRVYVNPTLKEKDGNVIHPGDGEASYMVTDSELGAVKPIHSMSAMGPMHFAVEDVDGLFGVAERGRLGIQVAAAV